MVERRVLVCLVSAAMFMMTGGCAKKTGDQAAKQPMTTAQRDSAIGESKLPGAGAVKRAIEVSDSAEARSNEETPW